MGSSQKSEPGDEVMGDIQDCWGNVEKFARIGEKSMQFICSAYYKDF